MKGKNLPEQLNLITIFFSVTLPAKLKTQYVGESHFQSPTITISKEDCQKYSSKGKLLQRITHEVYLLLVNQDSIFFSLHFAIALNSFMTEAVII